MTNSALTVSTSSLPSIVSYHFSNKKEKYFSLMMDTSDEKLVNCIILYLKVKIDTNMKGNMPNINC